MYKEKSHIWVEHSKNSIKGTLRLAIFLLCVSFALHLVLSGYLIYTFSHNVIDEFLQSTKTAWADYTKGPMTFDSFKDHEKKLAMDKFMQVRVWVFAGAGVYLLLIPVTKELRKRGSGLDAKEYVRGARLETLEQYINEIKRRKQEIRLMFQGKGYNKQKIETSYNGHVCIPIDVETYHFGIAGATGSGKTSSIIAPLVAQLYKHNLSGIILDVKGDMVKQFYNPGRGDLIFCPYDSRSISYSILADVETVQDIELIARTIIPARSSKNLSDPFWEGAARQILTGLLTYCFQNKQSKNSDIWQALNSEIPEIRDLVRKTTDGIMASRGIADEGKVAQSLMAVLTEKIYPLRYLKDGDFSIRKWQKQTLVNGQPGRIFLLNREDMQESLSPALGFFLSLFSKHFLSLPDNNSRRLFFVLDEFASLGRMDPMLNVLRLGRSKGASVWIAFQELGQIDAVYGREGRQTILGGLRNIFTFSIKDLDTAKHFSDLYGKQQFKCRRHQFSYGHDSEGSRGSMVEEERTESLFMPEELMGLKNHECIYQVAEYNPAITKLKHCQYNPIADAFKPRPDFALILNSMPPKRDILDL